MTAGLAEAYLPQNKSEASRTLMSSWKYDIHS